MLVRVLGRIRAEAPDGRAIDPPSGPQRRMLALFAMRAGRPVSSETIGDLFELTPGAVRTSVSRLRKLLGSDVLTSAPGGYLLDAETDADRFQSAVTTARSLSSEAAIPHLVDALEMFDGPPLDEFADEPWAISEVTRLNELRAAVVEDLALLNIDHGEFDAAIDSLHRHIEQFPYRDRPRELLMQALALSGRQVEALRAFQSYRTTLIEDVGVEPGESIRELEGRIAAGELTSAPTVGRRSPSAGAVGLGLSNLPAVPNEFVGREDDAAAIAQALADVRLVTLVGPGGVGKTRLAVQVAGDRTGLHADGVWIAELVDCESTEDIVRTIADELSVRAADAAELAEQLSGRDLVLVVDNCEHVVDEARAVIGELLAVAARLRIIATSRTPMHLVGERVIAVGPLSIEAAIALFEARALAVGVETTPEERPIIEEICRRLDGVPLALELAAASSRVLGPQDLRAQLDRRFEVLKGGQRGGVAGRHDSLRAAVESSYDALQPDTRRFFDRLSVFAGEVPLSAVEAVAEDLDADAFDLVAELVDMSMLIPHRSTAGTRYRMLETLRHYGLDRLDETDSTRDAEDRQIAWCAGFGEAQAAAAYGASESMSIDSLVAAAPNLRLAVSRLVERDEPERACDLVLSFDDLAYASNVLAEVVRPLADPALGIETADDKRLLAMELIRRSTSGSTDTRGEVAESLAAQVTVDDPGPVLVPVLLIATALGHGVEPALLDAITDRARDLDDVAERARLLVAAGLARYYGDSLPRDFEPVEEAMQASRRAGMRRLAVATGSMACIAGIRMRRPLDGARLARPVLADLDELSHPSIMSNGLVTLYTEAAIQADLAPQEHLLGIRRAGPNLHGDFNRLGLALARVVQQHGHHALAVRAVGACETTNRSGFSTAQVETILEFAGDEFDEREIDTLLAAGAVSEQSDLYREMWSVLESMMYALPA